MIKKLNKPVLSIEDASISDMRDKINEIIDFLNDTYLMKQKDGQYITSTDDTIITVNDSFNSIADCVSQINTIKCPHCGASYYTEMYSQSTALNYPPIYKNGVNINPDLNQITTHCRCLNCGKEFDI